MNLSIRKQIMYISNIKNKYKDVDWNSIESKVKSKILDGIT